MDKLIKISNVIDKFLKFFFVLQIVCFSILFLLIGGIMIFFAKNKETISTTLVLTDSIGATIPLEHINLILISILISIFVLVSIACIGIFLIRNFLQPMKEGLPFKSSIGNKIEKFGWFTVIAGIINNTTNWILWFVFCNVVKDKELISIINSQNKIDVTFIIIAAFVFLFAHIFRYGEQLQKQADETV